LQWQPSPMVNLSFEWPKRNIKSMAKIVILVGSLDSTLSSLELLHSKNCQALHTLYFLWRLNLTHQWYKKLPPAHPYSTDLYKRRQSTCYYCRTNTFQEMLKSRSMTQTYTFSN
jgi:hypothetical protein